VKRSVIRVGTSHIAGAFFQSYRCDQCKLSVEKVLTISIDDAPLLHLCMVCTADFAEKVEAAAMEGP